MDPITITLTLLALKTVLGGKTAVSTTPEIANAQQQLADATALNTRIQQEVVVLKQQAEQAKRDYENANDVRIKSEAANRAVEAQKQRDEGLRVQAASAQDVADLKQQLAVAVGVAQTARDERDRAQSVMQKRLTDATALNTKIQQEVVVLQKQTEQTKQDLQRSGEARRDEKEAAFAEAQKQRDEGLRVQAESAKVVAGLQQQLVVAEQRSGEARRDEKEAAFQREMALKAQYAEYELGLGHQSTLVRELADQNAQYQLTNAIQKAAYERAISELQAAAASKTAPVTITKSVTSRDLNRN